MDKISNSHIYEFMENLYDEVEKRDGGYYPSKHDRYIAEEASKKFRKPIEEIDEIYSAFRKIASEKLTRKLNTLPPKLREKKRMEIATNIAKGNLDLPFSKLEGKPTEKLESGIDSINSMYTDVGKLIGENGWSIPMNMGLSKIDDLLKTDVTPEFIDDIFKQFYKGKNFINLVKHIKFSSISNNLKALFDDCLYAYNDNKYTLCVNSLITIFEGVLSMFGDNKNDIRMMRICRFNMDIEIKKHNLIKAIIWDSCYNFTKTLYEKSNFDCSQPSVINRHWMLHGRNEKDILDIDCLKLFNAIHTLITMLKMDKSI